MLKNDRDAIVRVTLSSICISNWHIRRAAEKQSPHRDRGGDYAAGGLARGHAVGNAQADDAAGENYKGVSNARRKAAG